MGQPIWTTPAGSLSTVNSGTAVSIQLMAESDTGAALSYSLNGGSLPTGTDRKSTRLNSSHT